MRHPNVILTLCRWLAPLIVSGCGGTEVPSPLESAVNAAGPVRSVSNNVAAAPEAVWPRFRGPAGDGSSAATGLPLEWSASDHIAWKIPLPGPGASSPIVWGDRVYLTYYSGYFIPDQPGGSLDQLERHLLAVRLTDGELLWDRAISAKLPEEEQIRDHGYAANTPLADAERVYVFFGKSGVLAFNHEGEQQWTANVGAQTNGWGTAASPILVGDLLIINASVESESLVALDRQTGEERWRADGIREAWNTPVLVTAESGREELVVAIHGELLAFAPQTGERLWSCRTEITWYMAPSLIVHDDIIYSLGGRSGVASLAVRAGGSGDVTATHRLWTSNEGSNVSSPVYRDGHLYFMNDQRGTAYCMRASDGEVLYEQRLERAGQVYASALLAEGRIYFLTRDGKTFVLAARPEFEQLAVNDLRDGSLFNGSPAAAGGQLLIRSDKFLYCIGE
ncbi:MAG: PQQ-binding-like beta-propeller repeat protein [Planctomycetaceae bacterium]|nr:PQQ-binding-like beta-propeller repeat protein [Planctomycetaceae bacterium]